MAIIRFIWKNMSVVSLEPNPLDEGMQPELLEELHRVLESQFFRTSKRCSAMLRYVVEHAAITPDANVKERTIGVEVFQRSPDYDTTADPVVRTTAGEIRKRLAQYFAEHPQAKLLITLPPGSYLPIIRERAYEEHRTEPPTAIQEPVSTPADERLHVVGAPSIVPVVAQADAGPKRWRYYLLFAATAVVITVCALAWKVMHRSSLEDFWNPITSSGQHPNICLGDLTSLIKPTSGDEQALATSQSGLVRTGVGSRDQMALADVAALNKVAGYLAVHGSSGTVLNAASTSFAQLRDQPLILIGGRSNQWSMREMSHLPFQIVNGPAERIVGIRDSRKGDDLLWMVDFNTPYEQIKKEYAIVARFRNPETNQPTLLVAGVGANGTIAGSVFATQANYLDQFAAGAPAGWSKGNVEVVLETDIIHGDYAPPRILASATW